MAKILHIGKYYPPFAGGIENFLADLMPAQIALDHDVAALVHDHQFSTSRFFAPIEKETVHNATIYRVPSYGRILYAPVCPHFPFWLNRVLDDFQPEILHIHVPNTSAFWLLFSTKAKKIPWVVHWHSDVTSDIHKGLNIAYQLYQPFERRLLKQATKIIATSQPYAKFSPVLQQWQDKVVTIPLGTDIKRLPEANNEAKQWADSQWQTNKVRILSVGRLTYYKGYDILIQAAKQVTDIEVIIVGKGEEKAYLQQLITHLKLEKRVKLLGYCSDNELTGLFTSCDAVCLPSLERTEAFGMVLIEAMRYAKPTIASQITGSGMTWVVQMGKTGFLVPPKNVVALGQALRNIQSPLLRSYLGAAGYQRFIDTFDIQKVAENVNTLYDAIL